MADGGRDKTSLTLTTVEAISDVDADAWNRLASDRPRNPFSRHAFLKALEESGSVGERAGWIPRHLLLKRGDDLVGAAAMYAKLHSQGEYIFDHHWASAYERAGGRYYPKLLIAAPFTPANGPRLLAADAPTRRALAAAAADAAGQFGVSSLHVNFVDPVDDAALNEAGYLRRETAQYHWFNRDYQSYDDFLTALSSRKRKAIRRERRAAAESDIEIRRLRGAEITEAHWEAFWVFYQDTGARKWGAPYLARSFFSIAAETMGDDFLLVVAERDGSPIAGALNIIAGDCLYGRYWGCVEHHPFLHFEVCYHQAIEFAIEHGLARVEAGAQGEHKIARGYEPVATVSRHHFVDAGFRRAIDDYLEREREHNAAEIDVLENYTPFKKGDGGACGGDGGGAG